MPTTVTSSRATLIDLIKMTHENQFMRIADVLREYNGILADVPWMQGNGMDSHKIARVASYPTWYWSRYNQGVAATQGKTVQVLEAIRRLEALSSVDVRLAKDSPDPMAFRSNRDVLFVPALDVKLANTYFYGDSGSDPDQIDGLSVRCNTVNSTVTSGPVVIDNGGTSTLTSIYAVSWGDAKVYGCYPRNHSSYGLNIQDKGEQRVLDGSGNPFYVYETAFELNTGLCVENYRYLGRLANINSTAGGAGDFDEDNLLKLLSYFPDDALGSMKMYANRQVFYQIMLAAKDKQNVTYMPEDVFGTGIPIMVLRFAGVEIKKCEGILNTETQVV